MSETLLSVGIDIGTSTTSLVVSRLHLQNNAGAFAVPDYRITEKEILYRSDIHFTPLLSDDRIDAPAIRAIVDTEYQKANIQKSRIQTGAVIITGETARKENARQVAQELSGYAGDFVVATAGPELESELAARGAGAQQWAQAHHGTLIHLDIGGGTSNLAVFDNGSLLDTGCLNVGGRLLRMNPQGQITWKSPVLDGITDLKVGDIPEEQALQDLTALLTRALEEAVGRRPPTELSERLTTSKLPKLPLRTPILSFSGGVGAILPDAKDLPSLAFGDIGVLLAREIRDSRLTEGQWWVCPDAIRATVIGAGCHSTTLSGSTIYYQNARFPMRGLPVVCLPESELASDITEILSKHTIAQDSTMVLYVNLNHAPSFDALCRLADAIVTALPDGPIITATRTDCAKALGQALACRVDSDRTVVCLDALSLMPDSYLDIGCPVAQGEALPVVIKTLIFSS